MSFIKRSKVKGKEKKHINLKLEQKSRKQMRKELRKQKKVNKAIYLRKKNKLHAMQTQVDKPVEKIIVINESENDKNNTVNNSINKEKETIKKSKQQTFEYKKKKQKNKLLKEANLEEDKIIKKLEKKLKLNKRKNKMIPKSFVADGLDYLLNFSSENDGKYIMEQKLLQNGCDDEIKTKEDEDEYDDDEDKYDESKTINNSLASVMEKEVANNDDNLHILDSKKIKCDIGCTRISTNVGTNEEGLWEDIYGRKRDREGNIIHETAKYISPATRNTMNDMNMDNENLHSLKKRLKGCINRLAEHNIHNIATQIEEIYMTNSRNNINHILSNLIFEALISHVHTPDRLICEHMMLIAILQANVGIEIGAQFLEKLVKKFFALIEEPQDVENKQLDNVILMISHLYNFKVYGHKLLYQILNKLLFKFSEKEIELILIILKTVGFPLRKDDPIALKEFIQNLQQKARDKSSKSSRVKFMLDVLLAIKNNNVNKIPQYDPSHVEHLKKVIKTIIRKGNTITQFNASLDDLLHADENGKWWIIGSAWSKSNNIDNQQKIKQDSLQFEQKILELAQKQRMNTDTRKNIFCVLMTAEDYLDAFEKLHHLGLKNQQEEQIMHVLIHCCLQENKFNPYYAVLAQKLCEYNRKYQLTIQYNLWDKLKTLESYGMEQLNNLAQFCIYLFIKKCLFLSVFKVIQFTELDKHTMKLLRQIIVGILLHKNEQACLQVFERISASSQLQSFREGLRLFINYFVIKNVNSNSMLGEKEVILKKRAELVDKILILRESKIIF